MTTTPSQPPAPQPSQPARPRRKYGIAIAATLFAMVAVAAVIPDVVRLDRFSPFAQLVAFRPLIAAAAAVVAVLLGLLAIKFHRLLPFVAVLVVVVCVAASLVLPRVVSDSAPAPAQGRQLTVLAFNAFNGIADPDVVADLIRTEQPDLVALPESGPRFRNRLAPLVRAMGYQVFSADDARATNIGGMTALAASRLGNVQMHSGSLASFPYVELTGGALGELRFAAVHATSPVLKQVPEWRDDLPALSRWCAGDTPAIVAGDLNATLDHSVLRDAIQGCSDAADQVGDGLIGTWPLWRPRWVGPQIDHVLATGGIAAQSFSVHDMVDSDHRAIVSRLALP